MTDTPARQVDLTKSRTAWPLSVKVRRGLWTYVLEPLVRWLPKVASPIRCQALRLMGASIGRRCMIMPGVKVLMPWNLHMGDHSALGRSCDVYNFSPVRIGRMTVISQGCYLCTGTHDYTHPHMPLTHEPITIGDNCWLTADVFVSPGVKISDGVVVGARSVVAKDLSVAWSVYAGHPCKKIKDRVMRTQP